MLLSLIEIKKISSEFVSDSEGGRHDGGEGEQSDFRKILTLTALLVDAASVQNDFYLTKEVRRIQGVRLTVVKKRKRKKSEEAKIRFV